MVRRARDGLGALEVAASAANSCSPISKCRMGNALASRYGARWAID